METLKLDKLPKQLALLLKQEDVIRLSNEALEKLSKVLSEIDPGSHAGLRAELAHIQREDIHLANFSTILGHASQIENRSKTVGLDVGCSFGLKTIMLRYFGFEDICGSDVAESLIRGANVWVEQSKLPGFEFKKNNIDGLPYEDNRFDWVTAMGLYANLNLPATKGLFGDCYRVLKPGGMFMFHDSANPRVPRIAEQIKEFHKTVEIGTGTADAPNGNCYAERHTYIQRNFPDFSEADVVNIAKNTCYSEDKDTVHKACEAFKVSGTVPNSPFEYGSLEKFPTRLENGTPCRRPTDPFTIRAELEEAGFSKVTFRQPVLGRHLYEDELEAYFSVNNGVFINAHK